MSSGASSTGSSGPVLRIVQVARTGNSYSVQLDYRGGQQQHSPITTTFSFSLTPQEQEHLRWYLEDYLEHPTDPAPQIAAGVVRKMEEVGVHLFRSLFQSSDDARFLWADLRARLNSTRIEVVSGVDATTIPWELMRDPHTATLLALRARDFVRGHSNPALHPVIPATQSGPIRILLVICRPGRSRDVPFRSVASRIIKGLSEEARAHFQLDVLRPPTYEQLSRVLHAARDRGQPYHVLHFDGHGAFLDVREMFKNWEKKKEAEIERYLKELGLGDFDHNRLSPQAMYPRPPREGDRGYLLFENPDSLHNIRLVDGPDLGALLREADVHVLVLNACRSAHAEAPPTPEPVADVAQPPQAGETGEAASAPNPHEKVRAYGSLAQEVMDAGVAGVVAMRYNVYVVTAAQFVADLYASLVGGSTLGEAVRVGRRQLYDRPLRSIAHRPLPLQDWPVPVVYEAAPIALFPKQQEWGADGSALNITIHAADATRARGALDADLPKPPDVGFYGRDETLLALDRAFDRHRVVLLHAFAGSGKTTTAAEFARWYSLTGGVQGRVFFTSFEQPRPLARVLDQLGQAFGPALEQNGIHWLALDEGQRRQVALDVLRQVPVLWVWDNVEPVAGFPAGTPSTLSAQEQRELADFLRDAQATATTAKFLLTSRRDERGWLGDDLPVRVTMPPMPMQERLELAKALAERHGRRMDDVEDWRPLLRYTGGNPLTITVVVGQALRDGLSTGEQVEAYVARLRAGEAAFEDEESEGRTRSLGASLSYGFTHAFSEEERRQLALLHLFQGIVAVHTLRLMGTPEAEWSLSAVRGMSQEAGITLLDRAAEVGLLTALGGGYYTIHPALPWYFKGLFDSYYGGDPTAPTRAYVEAIGYWGDYYHNQFNKGNREVIGILAAEEENLLHAWRLARANGWWHGVTSAMQGLDELYGYTGRRAEWQRLVEEVVPDFVDPIAGDPLPGREEDWILVTGYRVILAMEARQWEVAERLQCSVVEWTRSRAAPILALPPEGLDDGQRNRVRTLAVSIEQLGNILRGQGRVECVSAYEEAVALYQRIGGKTAEAVAAFNLGHAYKDVPILRDLDQAEHWYNRSLELRDEGDRLGRGKGAITLGNVAYERFKEARDSRQPEELLRYLKSALEYYLQALAVLPPGAVADLAVTHNQLGNIYSESSEEAYFDRALRHWGESIRLMEAAGNIYGAAVTQFNMASGLAERGRFDEALLYAQAALRNFTDFGPGAAADVQRTQGLIAAIEKLQKEQGG